MKTAEEEQLLREYNRQIAKHHKANFYLIALRQIMFRIGWVFKTESIVVPALITSLTSSPFMIGLFPMASRLGKFVPQLFAANLIEPLKKRKHALILLNLGVLGPWGIVASWCWLKPENTTLFLWFFFLAYASFWMCTGAGLLAMHTIIGKVIRYNFRGRMMRMIGLYSVAFTIVGSLLATYIMRGDPPLVFPYNFALLFTLTFVLFLAVFVCTVLIREPEYPLEVKRDRVDTYLKSALALLRDNANVRKVVIVGWTYSLAAAMFPFFTVFATKNLGISMKLLASALFLQHGANALGQVFVGPLADRRGNRFVMVAYSLLTACIPLVPLAAKFVVSGAATGYVYLLVYFMIGVSVGRETYMSNYVLEIAPLEKQPLYVGTVNLVVAFSSLLPVAIGALLLVVPYEVIFVAAALFTAFGALVAWSMDEPRFSKKPIESTRPDTVQNLS